MLLIQPTALKALYRHCQVALPRLAILGRCEFLSSSNESEDSIFAESIQVRKQARSVTEACEDTVMKKIKMEPSNNNNFMVELPPNCDLISDNDVAGKLIFPRSE